MKTLHLVPARRKTETLCLGGLAGWALTAWQTLSAGIAKSKQSRQLYLVETLSLGGKRQLLLVGCGSERYLVGAGAESVQSILRVDDAKARHEQPEGSQDHTRDLGEQT